MDNVSPIVRPAKRPDAEGLARLIADAYRDVALRFNLTLENCLKHPSNCTVEWILRDMDRGVVYFVAEKDGHPVGCAALECPRDGEGYLERLKILSHVMKH